MMDLYSIGKIVAAHGLTGEMIVQHSLGKKTDLKGLKTIFIEEKKGSFLPYFVEKVQAKTDTEVYLKLEEINTKESVRRVAQKQVWLDKKDFDAHVAGSAPLSMLGYKMMHKGEAIGEVIEIIEQPMQLFFKIMYNGNEALIPIHQESLEKIDQKKKLVFVRLPDGLLDIYS